MLNSLLTRLGVNNYNQVIDQFFYAISSSAICVRGTTCSIFCLLGKFDILSPDEIERLAEKLVTLYQDDIEQRFSKELLQFVDYSNEFLDYAEDTIDMYDTFLQAYR